jgi:hypothetical protein
VLERVRVVNEGLEKADVNDKVAIIVTTFIIIVVVLVPVVVFETLCEKRADDVRYNVCA